jgi:hypothetical protein
MSCVLRIEGKNFRVDDFLRETSLEAFKVWHSGEPLTPKRKNKSHHITNGCNIEISKADFEEFELQRIDAIRYLTANFDQLKRLREFGLLEAEVASLDFGIYTRMFEAGMQVDMFQPDLLRLAGTLNFAIELSQYEPASEE